MYNVFLNKSKSYLLSPSMKMPQIIQTGQSEEFLHRIYQQLPGGASNNT